ncbi:MAG: hypothetical protein IKU26_06430 [Clostridia bacterium]|nr:hypothetical protein [Clostridia bacterium]
MLQGVCYLYGNYEMPAIHGTITFREARQNYVCFEIDIQGILDRNLYGLSVGDIVFPPLSPDTHGNIQVIYCRKNWKIDAYAGVSVSLFRYDRQSPDLNCKHKTVAQGTVRKLICGGGNYQTEK